MLIQNLITISSNDPKFDQKIQDRFDILNNSFEQLKADLPEVCLFPQTVELNSSLIQGTVEICSGKEFIDIFSAHDQCNLNIGDIRNMAAKIVACIRLIQNTIFNQRS